MTKDIELIKSALLSNGIELTEEKVKKLWKKHSSNFGSSWLKVPYHQEAIYLDLEYLINNQ